MLKKNAKSTAADTGPSEEIISGLEADLRTIAGNLDLLSRAARIEIKDGRMEFSGADGNYVVDLDELKSWKQVIEEALNALNDHACVTSSLNTMCNQLLKIDEAREAEIARPPDGVNRLTQIADADTYAAICALEAVKEFVWAEAPYNFTRPLFKAHALSLLQRALSDLLLGEPAAAMLRPIKLADGGRPRTTRAAQEFQGAIAGLARRQQLAGMTRDEAAKWVVKHTPEAVRSQFSPKPLTVRSIKQWQDKFGRIDPEDRESENQWGAIAYAEASKPFLAEADGSCKPISAHAFEGLLAHLLKNVPFNPSR
jgi:hypothetical protein